MAQRIRVFFWFLSRPTLYPHALHLLGKKLVDFGKQHDNTRAAALQWCADRAQDTGFVIEQLTGTRPARPIAEELGEEFSAANTAARLAPANFGGPGNLELLYRLTEHLRAIEVLETGVASGWSSLAILLSLRHRPGSRLVSTDMPTPLTRRDDEPLIGCVVPDNLRSNWTVLPSADRTALPRALSLLPQFDLCHYDSDKSYSGRMWAYPLLWRGLRPGGVFLSDDVGDNFAFRDFAESVGQSPVVVEQDGKYVGLIVKETD